MQMAFRRAVATLVAAIRTTRRVEIVHLVGSAVDLFPPGTPFRASVVEAAIADGTVVVVGRIPLEIRGELSHYRFPLPPQND
jgi:hypothetical protein